MNNKLIVGQSKDYISQLQLPDIDRKRVKVYDAHARAFQDDEKGGAVAAGSMVSFVSGLTALHKSDCLNSTLLAQLAANKQFNRYTQTRQWYDFYISVLANVGWVVPAFAYRDYAPSGDSLVLSDAVLDILAAIATGDEILIMTAALESLRDKDGNEKALKLFDHESFPESFGTFQVLPVGEDDGQLVMALSALEFSADKHVTRFLWFTWQSTRVKLFQSSQKAVLNEEIYGQVRQEVIKKLGDRAAQFIIDIEL
ncbi:MAG: hypothetical protein ACREO8_09770 [Luteimonas sp.]